MKSISIFILLFIIKSSISNSSIDELSISKFIYRIKKEGNFEIIKSIKKLYGQDFAIISCEELYRNTYGNCKKLITEYMPSLDYSKRKKNGRIGSILFHNIMKKNIANDHYKLIKLLKPNDYWDKLREILSKKLSPEKAKLIADRIIKRVEQELGQRQRQEKEPEKEKEKEKEPEKEKEKEKERELEKEKELEKKLEKEQVQIN